MKTDFQNKDVFNWGQDNISVYVDGKRYQVYYSEAKNVFWIWYNSNLVEVTIPSSVHSLVQKSLTK